jgi:DNA-directed RNA polymerase specialized sigma24 family protein
MRNVWPLRSAPLSQYKLTRTPGLVARAQSGDLDAFEDLVNRHSRRVYRALVGVVGSFDEAQDATQETFLKAFQHIGQIMARIRGTLES